MNACAGFDAIHVNHLGLSGKPDRDLADRIVRDEFTFVTNNRIDFLQLFARMEVHAGLIVLVPNFSPALSRITAMAEAGASDATLMAVAGHMSRRMLEHYSHVRMAAKRTALEKLESSLMGGLGNEPSNPRPSESSRFLYLLDVNGGRDRTRTCDLLRVKQAL
jgi:uncharacterized protein DUF5615